MELLRKELSHLLGEKLSRIECISKQADTTLWSLYDGSGSAIPLLAKSYDSQGIAEQVAWKISMLSRSGTVRLPAIYGVITHDNPSGPDVLLIERLRGVPAEAPARTTDRWEQLKDQIVEGLLSWHRIDSGGCVGKVDNTQENSWPDWYRQRVDELWNKLADNQNATLTMTDRRILFRTRECLPDLFEGFSDNCVLVHGNFTLNSMLKDSHSDQLLAMVNPGLMLWAPREYEVFRLIEPGIAENLLWHYLQRAPVSESFIWRRWLYVLWDQVAQLLQTGRLNRPVFDQASKALLPWLA